VEAFGVGQSWADMALIILHVFQVSNTRVAWKRY